MKTKKYHVFFRSGTDVLWLTAITPQELEWSPVDGKPEADFLYGNALAAISRAAMAQRGSDREELCMYGVVAAIPKPVQP